MSNVRDLVDIQLLKEMKELLKKEEKKPVHWWDSKLTPIQIIKLWIFLALCYPFIGPLYKWFLLKVL